MARSPLTLAASVTSALPGAVATRVSPLSERVNGAFDSALVEIDGGVRVVVRVPNDENAAARLADELRALDALTAGVRELLPFQAPHVLGQSSLGGVRAAVMSYVPGYRVEAPHVPAGRGLAPSLGAAIAAVHALPTSIVRSPGLPARTTSQVRAEVTRLLDRADATERVPVSLTARWRRAVADDGLWRFETTVTLGGVTAASFVVEDLDEVPTVTGLLEWHGLGVADPALDLQWLASSPDAADDVFAAYSAAGGRSPDPMLRARSRLYAELEFAKWLVHGYDEGNEDVLTDAEELLRSLAQSTGGEDIAAEELSDADSALAMVANLAPSAVTVDTSMQTDAYDADELSGWLTEDDSPAASPEGAGEPGGSVLTPDGQEHATEPIELGDLEAEIAAAGDTEEAERASDAALRRWLAD
ncbi:phosphotransferase [Microbacterium sp. C7(2022)]|uniref:phosphotransferase n=1 Tax=Microbacterium sp. C7(2022) TaxID=2992759 RepID=UPI00237AF5FA|nr:phosphotransferase [Microbacterium sp. C7(2022)]MDE0545687.1 phosphotransferase [Microbacterium sp. C7(2022)]